MLTLRLQIKWLKRRNVLWLCSNPYGLRQSTVSKEEVKDMQAIADKMVIKLRLNHGTTGIMLKK